MLQKILKRTGIAVVAFIALVLCAYGFIAYNIHSRVNQVYRFPKSAIQISADAATLERGKHLLAIKGCTDCHGGNLGGKVMISDGAMGTLAAVNLTRGKGGLPADYTDADWLMALQHGVGTDGKPLLLMPSQESTQMTEQDLKAIIAYCKSLPAVNHVLPETRRGPLLNVLTYTGKMPLLSVEKINHAAKLQPQLADTTESVAMGKYLAVSCSGCHRPDFKGGDAIIPGSPAVPNITTGGHTGRWTQQQFTQVLRTGKTPEGHQLNTKDMPWKMTAQYTDKEIASLYKFLRTI